MDDPVTFGTVEISSTPPKLPKLDLRWQERAVLLASLGLVVVGLLVWAVFVRKRKRRRHGFRRHHHSIRKQADALKDEIRRRRSMRARKRKRKYRRNPTLAETGGLPPVRGDDSLENRAEQV